jgi:hypothetical protein
MRCRNLVLRLWVTSVRYNHPGIACLLARARRKSALWRTPADAAHAPQSRNKGLMWYD